MLFSLFRRAVPTLSQTGPGGLKQTHPLVKEHTTIGRAAEADIVIDDPYLAPIHARIEREKNGGILIRRMGLNPVLLRGEAMLQTASIKSGDVFRLGRDIEFELVERAKKTVAAEQKRKEAAPAKPFYKRPQIIVGAGVIYLALLGGGAYALLGGGGGSSDKPTAARIATEANGIPRCIQNARKLRNLSEAAFKGAVATATAVGASYVALASAAEPSDPAALKVAATPIADAYRSVMLAGLDAETRLNLSEARRLYQRGFELVPDIQCSAGRYAMTRRAATAGPSRRGR